MTRELINLAPYDTIVPITLLNFWLRVTAGDHSSKEDQTS